MIIEIFPEAPGEPFARVTINGREQKVSALFVSLAAGRVGMTVWDYTGHHDAQAFLEKHATVPSVATILAVPESR